MYLYLYILQSASESMPSPHNWIIPKSLILEDFPSFELSSYLPPHTLLWDLFIKETKSLVLLDSPQPGFCRLQPYGVL